MHGQKDLGDIVNDESFEDSIEIWHAAFSDTANHKPVHTSMLHWKRIVKYIAASKPNARIASRKFRVRINEMIKKFTHSEPPPSDDAVAAYMAYRLEIELRNTFPETEYTPPMDPYFIRIAPSAQSTCVSYRHKMVEINKLVVALASTGCRVHVSVRDIKSNTISS